MEIKVKSPRSKINPLFLTTLTLIPIVNLYVWFNSNQLLASIGVPLWLSILSFGLLMLLGMLAVWCRPIEAFLSGAILFTSAFIAVFVLMGLGDGLLRSSPFLLLEQVTAYLLFMTLVQIPNFSAVIAGVRIK